MAQTIIDISSPNDGLGDPLRDAFNQVNQMFTELYTNKVDKIPGMGLSSNDFTTVEKIKLSGIEEGAEVNVQADLLEDDDTQDSFVNGKELLNSVRTLPQIEFYDGLTSTYILPANKEVNSITVVRAVLYESEEWTQFGDTVTISRDMVVGNRIQINFF